MILSELVNDSYIAYRGKLSGVPAPGSEKYNRILYIANRKVRERARDTNVDWPDLYEQRELGTLTVDTQTYDVDDDILRPSDYLILTDTNGKDGVVSIIKPDDKVRFESGAYIYGANPQQLTFIQTITEALDGFTMTLPAFILPAQLVNPTDVVRVSNPEWAVYAVAAELARNDYAKEDQFANLNGIATDLYTQMVLDAAGSAYMQPNAIPNNMPQPNGLYFS